MTYVVYIKSGVKRIKYTTTMNRATNEASIWRLHESCYLMERDDTFDRRRCKFIEGDVFWREN